MEKYKYNKMRRDRRDSICGKHERKDDCYDSVSKKIHQYNDLRSLMPNKPDELGSSTALQAQEYDNYPLQAGNELAPSLKLEYDTNTNKYALPGLKVENTFDLVPGVEEAGSMYDQVTGVGYETEPFFWPRDQSNQWYVATQDRKYFYYAVWGQPLFSSLFGFGTASLFICRRKCDAKLIWVKNIHNYTLTKTEPNFLGNTNMIARVALAIHGNRLYITSMFTGVGPQLFAINKRNGDPVWTIAYKPPSVFGSDYLVTPETPYRSVDNNYPATSVGDLNLTVKELLDGTVSVFVGIASFQNAINPFSFTGFPQYFDQGALIRIDDLGDTATKVWSAETCAPLISVGDVISTGGPDELNPFRPGTDEVLIWRDTTESGTFDAPGGVYGKVLDYTGVNPGYQPVGYPLQNNETMPIVSNVLLFGGSPPLTENSFQNVWRSPLPGIGSGPNIYHNIPGIASPTDITTIVNQLNIILSTLAPGDLAKYVLWGYLSQVQVDEINSEAWGESNSGVRYIAALPDGYEITNIQEAKALDYYGNSVWGQAPSLDIKRNMIYFGTGQTHDMLVDETLFYQNPSIEYLNRRQPVIDAKYQYARLDSSTDGAPVSTVIDINMEKKKFIEDTTNLSLSYADRSPRGNMSYCNAIMGANLTTGKIEFGFRTVPWDTATFLSDDPNVFVIRQDGFILDGDVSSGIMYYENEGGKTYLASRAKSTLCAVLDISGLNPNVEYDHQNLLQKGVVPTQVYAGVDGALGGSNYGHSQDGGSLNLHSGANAASFDGAFSFKYNTGYYGGYEFVVSPDGKVFPVQNSVATAVDVDKKEISWQIGLGQRSHAITHVYNGVMFLSRGDGILFGIDVQNGNVVWKMDGKGEYGMSGISPPTFDDGRGIWIDNYVAAGGAVGQLGGTGVKVKVDEDLLLTPCDNVGTLTRKKKFVSFDVLPKSRGPSVFEPLVENETVKHKWCKHGHLKAVHTDLETKAETVLFLKAINFIHSSSQIIFKDLSEQSGIRYISLTFINRNVYTIKYQVLVDGIWKNKEATLKLLRKQPLVEEHETVEDKIPEDLCGELKYHYDKVMCNCAN